MLTFVGRTLCVSLLLAATVFAASPAIQSIDDFNNGLSSGWEHKVFNGQTQYRIIDLEGETVLHAQSDAAASALVFKKNYQLRDYPILSWRWRVDKTLRKGDARIKAGDDYAARVYVVFPHWFAPKTRSINYIWANKLPKGTQIASRYAKNSVMIAVQTGVDNSGRWVTERHNVAADYRRAFGEEPPPVGAIAIMTDSDDTGESVMAWYDDIRIESESAPL